MEQRFHIGVERTTVGLDNVCNEVRLKNLLSKGQYTKVRFIEIKYGLDTDAVRFLKEDND